MEKVVLKNNDAQRELITRIKNYMVSKARYEKKKQDINNQTILGNVSFWFQKAVESDDHFLVFTKDAASWDVEVIKLELDILEFNLAKLTIY